jgi:hypothetical protein
MLTRAGAKLLDFGLAKTGDGKAAVEAISSLKTLDQHPLTEQGTILGTFQYMAPEQLEGAPADPRTDALGFAVAWARRAPLPAPLVRFTIANPEGVTDVGPPVISPDGRTIAFDAADASGRRQIWLRPLDALEARPLPGTEGVLRPFWSPDSRTLAFVASGKLRKAPAAGGPPQTICDAPRGADGSWSGSGVTGWCGSTGAAKRRRSWTSRASTPTPGCRRTASAWSST